MERIGGRLVAVALLGIAVVVTYCWCVRISDDLNWDEASSLRRYVQHPIVAAAYLHDSNNHPLDSFVRSIAFRVLGLNTPPFWRFVGFVVLLGFLAAAWRWRAYLASLGSTFAAAVLVVLLFLSHAIHEQALVLRGYFPTIVLQAVYFLLVARWSRLLEPPTQPATATAALSPRRRLALAALCALMMFLLPSNLVLMLILWPAAAIAFTPRSETAGSRAAAILRETLKLGLLSGAVAALLYLPIFVTIAMGITSLEHLRSLLPVYGVDSPLRAVIEEVAFVFQQAQPGRFVEELEGAGVSVVSAPGAMPDWLFAGLVGALLAASLAFRRRERGTQVAWALVAATLLVCCALAAFNATPARIKSPDVAPILFALVFLVHDLGVRWAPRVQILAALVVVALGYATLPATIRATRFDRRASDLASFVETLTKPSERFVVVAHDNAHILRPYLVHVFGEDRTLNGLTELRQRFSAFEPAPSRKIGSLERWVSDLIAPPKARAPIKPDDVDVLVLVGQKEIRAGAVTWSEPSLDALKQRLSRVSRYRRDQRDIEVYERP
jgi:hypothetical protein